MKIFIQKYYNRKGQIRFQVVCDQKLDFKQKTMSEGRTIIEEDILTYGAAEMTAKFYAKELYYYQKEGKK